MVDVQFLNAGGRDPDEPDDTAVRAEEDMSPDAEAASARRLMGRAIAAEVVAEARRRYARPTATYRLQFHAQFTFRDAAEIVPYLKRLGISHLYAAPYLRPRPGSTDGYSVCDPTELNPELGGEEGYAELLAALREHGLGQILDIVPNHMAAVPENPWWFDVLENGPSSPYAAFFDIDWNPVKQELADKVLLPVLGQQFGEALEEGQLRLEYREGTFLLRYYATVLPIGPKTLVPLLGHRLGELQAALGEAHADFTELQSIITSLEHLPPQDVRDAASIRERQRETVVVKRRLRDLTAASPAVAEHLDRTLADYNGRPGEPASFDLLDQLLSQQAYRLCHWRASFDEVNYRRFFDINELAAIDMQVPEVFWRTHAMVRRLWAEQAIDGVRIDHIDGLFDPDQYLWRLQWSYLADLAWRAFARQHAAPEAALGPSPGPSPSDEAAARWRELAPEVLRFCCQEMKLPVPKDDDLQAILGPETPTPAAGAEPGVHPAYERAAGELPLYVIAEKILGPDEPLPKNWPVAGTTGYDFLNELNGLFVAPRGMQEIVRAYGRFLGEHVDFEQIVRDAKRLILRVSMASELQMLAHRLNQISEQHRRTRDFTLNMLRYALREVLTAFPVYRVYPHKDGVTDRDRRFVDLAIAKARRQNPAWDPAVFEFIRQVLLLQHPEGLTPEAIQQREFFAGRFQQVTSPVMAKGVEDTTFYVYVPLISVNEVGGEARHPCVSVPAFHQQNQHRQAQYRQTLLATSTHDTKRSEDVRARLNVLPETPGEWRRAAQRFSRLNRRWRQEVDGEPAPSRNDEYLFYQALLGIWPDRVPNRAEREALVGRLQRYMEKATREAKQRTSWLSPNPAYDAAVKEFIAHSLAEAPKNRFVEELHEFHRRIVTAGYYNALFQVVLKLLSPGVPDIYRGQELWDFSLVDPDNRRPVDFELRRRLLDEIELWRERPDEERQTIIDEVVRAPHDPRLKLFVTQTLLALRRRRADLWLYGRYVPLPAKGTLADHVVAFGWQPEPEGPLQIVCAVPRFVLNLLGTRRDPWQAEVWADTTLDLPDGLPPMRNVFTGRPLQAAASTPLAALLERFPVAVLTIEE